MSGSRFPLAGQPTRQPEDDDDDVDDDVEKGTVALAPAVFIFQEPAGSGASEVDEVDTVTAKHGDSRDPSTLGPTATLTVSADDDLELSAGAHKPPIAAPVDALSALHATSSPSGGGKDRSHLDKHELKEARVDMPELNSAPAIASSQSIYLVDEDLQVEMAFYDRSTVRLVGWYVACVLSVGILFLVGRWYPRTLLRAYCKRTGLRDVEGRKVLVAVEDKYGTLDLVPLGTIHLPRPTPLPSIFPPSSRTPYESAAQAASDRNGSLSAPGSILSPSDDASTPGWTLIEGQEGQEQKSKVTVTRLRYLEYRQTRMLLHEPSGKLRLLSDWRSPSWVSTSSVQSGLPAPLRAERTALFGPNEISIRGQSVLEILIGEVLHPFYIFQLLSIALWSYDEYQWYALVIGVISIIGITTTTVTTKRSINRLRRMSRFVCPVRLLRQDQDEEKEKGWATAPSSELVPGDIIDLSATAGGTNITTLPCDCVLLEGDAIVNESMLTGESVPVVKTGIENREMKEELAVGGDLAKIDKHLLYGGTKIIRVRGPMVEDTYSADASSSQAASQAKALVIRTGFNTAKGSLVRSMLFEKPINFKFYADAFKFIAILVVIAVVGFIGCLVNFIVIGVDAEEIALRALDLFTICIPPALPAAMSICVTFSIARLRKHDIYCISPQRINVAGKINVVCFDKTGTLTAEGLDVLGVRCALRDARSLGPLRTTSSDLESDAPASPTATDGKEPNLLDALATTHSLKMLDGKPLGEPLEAKMFEFTNWTMNESASRVVINAEGRESEVARTVDGKMAYVPIVGSPAGEKKKSRQLATVRTFDFVSSLRRMGVVVKNEDHVGAHVYVKGAPEALWGICDPASFPDDYDTQLNHLTHAGYRVLALAGKSLPSVSWARAQSMKRSSAESQLTFLGLIVFENKLKPGSRAAISKLKEGAMIPCKMVTGDNVLTAISVGRECGIVDAKAPVYVPRLAAAKDPSQNLSETIEWIDVDDDSRTLDPYSLRPHDPSLLLSSIGLAVTGDTFRWLLDFSSRESLSRLLVHAQIFARMSPEQKQELVERLRGLGYTTAFVGDGANDCGALKAADVGLSLSEAEASIAAPFTSKRDDIGCVEHLIREGRAALATSFSCFKFMALYSLTEYVTVILLYGQATSMDNAEYLFIDVFIVLPIALGLANIKPSDRLAKQAPSSRLMSKKVVISLLGQIVLMIFAQAAVYLILHNQSWYIKPDIDPENLQLNDQDNSALFRVSTFNYVLVAAVFSVGPPHRKPLYQNIILFPAVVILSVFCLYFLFLESGPFFSLFGFVPLDSSFQWVIFGAVIINVVLSLIFEAWLVDYIADMMDPRSRRSWRNWFNRTRQSGRAQGTIDGKGDEEKRRPAKKGEKTFRRIARDIGEER